MSTQNDDVTNLGNSAKGASDEVTKLTQMLAVLSGKSFVDLQDKINRNVKSQSEYLAKSKKTYEETKNQIESFKNKIKSVGVTSDELEQELSDLRAQIARTTDAEVKAQLMKAKSDLELKHAGNQTIKTIQETTGKVIGIGLAGAVTSMTSALKSAAAGGTAMDVAASYMSAQLDVTNQQVQATAGGLQQLGGAMAGAGGRIGLLGIAATVAGGALGFLSNQITELAKAGIGFLLAQTNKMIGGFQEMSRVGAVYSGGMIEMTNTALSAGMTIDQFSKTVEGSRRELSNLGMGLNEASKKMANVMDVKSPGGKKLQEGMYALGMSAEEQGAAVAQSMALMAGPSGKLKASNAEVQAQTAEYAKNLKIISNITGEDAKAKMEKLRQDNDTLAFNSYLNSLSETERKKQVEAMNAMSAEDARAFREKKVYGTVVSADLNAMRATNSGIRKAQDQMFEASEKGTLTVEGVAKTYQTFQAEALASANEGGKSFGLAMGGIAQDLAKSTNSTVQYMIKFADAQKGLATIANTQNKGTQVPGADLMKANQDFAVALQEIAIPHIKDFAANLGSVIDMIKKAVKEVDSVGSGGTDFFSKAKELALAVLPQLATLVGVHYAGEYLKGKINKPSTSEVKPAIEKVTPATGKKFDISELPGIKQAEGSMNNASTGANKLGQGMESAGKSAIDSSAKLNNASTGANKLGQGMESAGKSAIDSSAKLNNMGSKINDFGKGLDSTGSKFGKLGKWADTMSSQINNIPGLKQAGGATSEIGAGATKLGGLGKFGGKLAKGATGGLGGLLGGLALDYGSEKAEQAGMHKTAAGLSIGSSALSGAGTGAMIGSIIGPLGTAIGAGVGAAAGGAYGLYKNWGTLMGKTPTPGTDAANAMKPESDPAALSDMAVSSNASVEIGKQTYDKIVEMVANQKSLADALGKDALTGIADASNKLAGEMKNLTSYTKEVRDNMAKLLQVSR